MSNAKEATARVLQEEAPMSNKDAVRKVLDAVKADKRTSLTAPEGKLVCDAYGIPVPKEGVAKSGMVGLRFNLHLPIAPSERHTKSSSAESVHDPYEQSHPLSGDRVAFSIMSNNHNLPSKRALETIDKIVTTIVEEGGKK